MSDPINMTWTELYDEVVERRAYDEVLEPVLEELGERMEALEEFADITYVGDNPHATGR